MERVAEPLRRMGAPIESTDGCLPLAIDGRELEAIEYQLPVASAQVKSAILLAGLGARGRTTVHRAGADARPHRADAGRRRRARHRRTAARSRSRAARRCACPRCYVPGDISSAAPFLVAAALLPGSQLTVHDIGLNPRRTGPARRARADGRARRASTTRRRSRASRSATSRSSRSRSSRRRSRPTRCRCSSTSCRSSGCSPRCARGKSYVNGAEELRAEGERPHRGRDRLAARDRRARARDADGFAVTRRPDRGRAAADRRARRPPHRDARRGRRASSRARACGSRAPNPRR